MNVVSLREVYPASRLLQEEESGGALAVSRLRGRLVEISCPRGEAGVTLAMSKIAEMHREGEPAAWVGSSGSLFYPPDAHRLGVCWEGLALVVAPDGRAAGRVADKLLRSGAFGMVVVDLVGARGRLAEPLLGRLLRLVEVHESGLLFLTRSAATEPSLSSLISLRVEGFWERTDPRQLRASYSVIKDKRRGPGAFAQEVYDGPMGLR
jgi:recombination protein RecA